MEERKVLVKDLEVNYKVFGEGRPMLILHGWGSSSARWEKVAELLAQKGVKVIIPDLPGFGLTLQPHNAWNMDNYVDWVYEISQKLPELNHSFYLLGHSFGGAIAVKFAIKYNQKINKLFLVAAACVRERTFIKKIYYRVSKVAKLFSFLPGYFLARKAFYKFIIQKSDYPHYSGIMKETYLKVVLEDLSWRLSFVKVPTIMIWGDKDDLTPMTQANFIHQKISHSQLLVIPGAKHALEIEVPEILAGKIIEHF